MGMIVHKENQRQSELNDRISEELRERARAEEKDEPDFVEDSDYKKDLKKTGKFSWIWFVLIGLALISVVLIVTI
ncbi:LPXTG cell wall anchor domain-containing protein [Candidatus Saccharibacteria bacterium]|jgi:LPXTG-motif cell wall-anchored protein|nr:LPXTG cell wall anchor domain-containing protein [Candidatus Saccharibacteria bacterium]